MTYRDVISSVCIGTRRGRTSVARAESRSRNRVAVDTQCAGTITGQEHRLSRRTPTRQGSWDISWEIRWSDPACQLVRKRSSAGQRHDSGADDGIRTGDPNLGNVMSIVYCISPSFSSIYEPHVFVSPVSSVHQIA